MVLGGPITQLDVWRINSVIILSRRLLDKTVGGQVKEEEREREGLQAEDGRGTGGVADNCHLLAGGGESLKDMVQGSDTAQIQRVPHGMETVRALGVSCYHRRSYRICE